MCLHSLKLFHVLLFNNRDPIYQVFQWNMNKLHGAVCINETPMLRQMWYNVIFFFKVEFSLFELRIFFSRLIAIPRLKNSVYPQLDGELLDSCLSLICLCYVKCIQLYGLKWLMAINDGKYVLRNFPFHHYDRWS